MTLQYGHAMQSQVTEVRRELARDMGARQAPETIKSPERHERALTCRLL